MQAKAYARIKNFLENNSASTDHGALNAEFDAAALSIAGIRANAALLQNDDGTIKNESVGTASLTAAARAAFSVPGPVGPPGSVGTGVPGVQGVKGDTGASFNADARDVFANRNLYNLQPKGFSMLAMDTGLLYFKLSGTAADWSAGVQYGKGETGSTGLQGEQGRRGLQGLQGIQGNSVTGPAGVNGTNGAITTLDTSTKTASLVGRSSVSARLVLSGGQLSILLTTA